MALLIPGGHLNGLAPADHCVEGHRNPLGLPVLIGLAGLGEEVPGIGLLLPDAEHLRPGVPGIVPVGEALPGESPPQGLHLFRGGLPVLPQGGGVHPGDHGHILGPLHPALQLQAGHPHLAQLPQVSGQRHVLQREGIAVGPSVPAVAQAAGLGTQAPVAAASAQNRGEKALSRVTHAQGAVAKNFDFNGGALADEFNGVPGELPGEDHTGHAQVGHLLHSVQVVNRHLGGGVDGQVGGGLAQHAQYAQILHQHRVHPQGAGLGGALGGALHLPVGDQCVQGQVEPAPPQVAVGDRLGELLLAEIFRVAAGVEVAVTQVNRVGAVLHSGPQGLHGTGGG